MVAIRRFACGFKQKAGLDLRGRFGIVGIRSTSDFNQIGRNIQVPLVFLWNSYTVDNRDSIACECYPTSLRIFC